MSVKSPNCKRIFIISGHYGSGKTEFAVSYALELAKANTSGYDKIAICDLDVVNPYFRSREQTGLLEENGVKVYGGLYGSGTTAEIPEISPAVRTPLEDEDCFTIVDVGGNDSGARILAQFRKYFNDDNTYLAAVVNSSRPETSTIPGAVEQLQSIESSLNMSISGIICNTHMLTETTGETIKNGYRFCKELSDTVNKEFWGICYPEKYVSADEISDFDLYKMPVGMYMRKSWLDK